MCIKMLKDVALSDLLPFSRGYDKPISEVFKCIVFPRISTNLFVTDSATD